MGRTQVKKNSAQKLVLFYKMQNGLCPDYLSQLVPNPVSYRSLYNFSNADHLQLIAEGTQLFYNSFLPSVVRQWNNLHVTHLRLKHLNNP